MPAGINDEVIGIIISRIISGCFSLQLYIPRCYNIEYSDNDTTTPHHTIFVKNVYYLRKIRSRKGSELLVD